MSKWCAKFRDSNNGSITLCTGPRSATIAHIIPDVLNNIKILHTDQLYIPGKNVPSSVLYPEPSARLRALISSSIRTARSGQDVLLDLSPMQYISALKRLTASTRSKQFLVLSVIAMKDGELPRLPHDLALYIMDNNANETVKKLVGQLNTRKKNGDFQTVGGSQLKVTSKSNKSNKDETSSDSDSKCHLRESGETCFLGKCNGHSSCHWPVCKCPCGMITQEEICTPPDDKLINCKDGKCTCPDGYEEYQRFPPIHQSCGQNGVGKNLVPDELPPCCYAHNVCYCTPGKTKKECDDEFCKCLKKKSNDNGLVELQGNLLCDAAKDTGPYKKFQRVYVGCKKKPPPTEPPVVFDSNEPFPLPGPGNLTALELF